METMAWGVRPGMHVTRQNGQDLEERNGCFSIGYFPGGRSLGDSVYFGDTLPSRLRKRYVDPYNVDHTIGPCTFIRQICPGSYPSITIWVKYRRRLCSLYVTATLPAEFKFNINANKVTFVPRNMMEEILYPIYYSSPFNILYNTYNEMSLYLNIISCTIQSNKIIIN